MRTAGTIAAFAAFAAIAAPPFTAASHAAPITYQGVLEDGGVNADGMYDMVFTLADQPVGGLALQTVNVDDVVVSDGLFEVEIDFDDDHFDGSDRWIAITVEGSILSPRQKITYSVYSVRAGIADDLQTPWIKDVTTRVLDVRSDFDTAAVIDTGSGPAALTARHDDTGATAMLTTRDNVGVEGDATGIIGEGTGVLGTGQVSGVIGIAQTTTLSETGASLDRIGVSGSALSTADSKPVNMYGLHGIASNPPASFLIPRDAYGVYGEALRGGDSFSSAYGVYGKIGGPPFGVGFAGYFEGDVHVSGTLTKSNGAFMIDHPVDPENMYLSHSFVESPEMLNVYSGVVDLDDRGRAVVELPGVFLGAQHRSALPAHADRRTDARPAHRARDRGRRLRHRGRSAGRACLVGSQRRASGPGGDGAPHRSRKRKSGPAQGAVPQPRGVRVRRRSGDPHAAARLNRSVHVRADRDDGVGGLLDGGLVLQVDR